MAYIPPHKRHDPSISASTNSQKGLHLHYSPFSVRRFLVVSESSSRLVEFVPFEGKPVFSHLEGSSLYAIKRESAVDEEFCTNFSLGNQEGNEFAIFHSIVEALRDDLASIIQKLKSTHVDNPAPTNVLLSIRRILFSASDGRSFDWEEPYTSRYVEEQINIKSGKWKKIQKTFYDPQPSNLFTFFKETAEQDGLQISTKERYFIVVVDNANPGTGILCCVCYVAEDPVAASQENGVRLQRLEIKKVKRATRLRHMVADIACIDKSQDLRIMLYTDEKCITGHVECTMDELMSSIEQALIRLWKCCP